jgi:hypothetical protein
LHWQHGRLLLLLYWMPHLPHLLRLHVYLLLVLLYFHLHLLLVPLTASK